MTPPPQIAIKDSQMGMQSYSQNVINGEEMGKENAQFRLIDGAHQFQEGGVVNSLNEVLQFVC